jgi:murein DD-endopeptidase MepM/ murein hydrolase activator NlpD
MFDDLRDVPKAIEHRVKASFDLPTGFGSNLFPARTTDIGGGTEVLNEKPIVIGPPLQGKNWVVSNGCCTVSIHRGAILAMDQKLLAAERYAIDWIRSDDQGHLLLPDDNTRLTDFPAYGKPILSVANGKVVKAVDRYPDLKPGVLDPDLTLKDAAGNHVIVDIGGGRYAIYAHLKPDSITVEEGDRVRRGQQIARLGNSGNTSAPHLHFHLMDAPSALGADHNLPYVFGSFAYQGRIEDDLTPVLLGNPEHREEELPLAQSVANFGASGGGVKHDRSASSVNRRNQNGRAPRAGRVLRPRLGTLGHRRGDLDPEPRDKHPGHPAHVEPSGCLGHHAPNLQGGLLLRLLPVRGLRTLLWYALGLAVPTVVGLLAFGTAWLTELVGPLYSSARPPRCFARKRSAAA